jgi:DNA polymerase-2
MSVACFEHIYMEHMHARGYVAPTLGIDQAPLERAPGGGIITPRAGLFEGILVFDFKSLYPSIIRTFNIDPLARVPHSAEARGSAGSEAGARVTDAAAGTAPEHAQAACITAPNGERFGREPGILPEILDRFTESRERAKREGNRAASYAYKIVMNSFYGVLGTDSCRFASSGLAGAITSFGQHILFRTRDRIRAMGKEVIYGDTDSLFVVSGLSKTAAAADLDAMGAELCTGVNAELAEYVRDSYGVESRLELEYEGSYIRFFLPPMRTGSADHDSEDLGRAKGYAGLRGNSLEVVGMEAVRHDWTPLAQELQRSLLDWVFHDVPAEEIGERIMTRISRLNAGEEDSRLAYRKLLRKPVEAYTKASPPHVRAAAMLPPEERTGLIRYVWTKEGPQPESAQSSPPDYRHYIEKQIRPIVEAVAPYAGIDIRKIFAAGGQMELF